VVFKTTCPTCEFTWPYLERLRKAAGPTGLRIVAVSQDDPEKAAAFNKRLGSSVETVYASPGRPRTGSIGTVPLPRRSDGRSPTRSDSRDHMEGFARHAAPAPGSLKNCAEMLAGRRLKPATWLLAGESDP
jgi:hypothetical protein